MRDKIRRFGWLALAVLFVVTGVGFGIYAFLVNTHPSSNSDIISCAKASNPPNQQPGKNGKVIGAQLADFKSPAKISFIYCTDYKVGTGAEVTSSNQTVEVNYVGALASNGTIFDSSFDNGQPVSFQLTQVITGWSFGLQGMKVGGVRRIFIPAKYGYGSTAISSIPANSDLVFDVQLLSVK